jgi:hypothetical protein
VRVSATRSPQQAKQAGNARANVLGTSGGTRGTNVRDATRAFFPTKMVPAHSSERAASSKQQVESSKQQAASR